MEENAARTPDSVAVIFEDEAMTYGELKQHSDNIAWQLQRESVQTDEVVAVITRRTLWLRSMPIEVSRSLGAEARFDS